MSNDGLAAYETWDMTAPVVPPRSRLFNLSPVGFGTSLVECLTSYFSRVAQAHSVSPGALHHHEVMKHGARRRNIFSCGINVPCALLHCRHQRYRWPGSRLCLGDRQADCQKRSPIPHHDPLEVALPIANVDAWCGRMVSRLSDQLGKGRQNCLCAFAVDIGSRQVLPLPPAPSAPDLPALQPTATIARPVLMGGLLHPMQALARIQIRARTIQSDTRFSTRNRRTGKSGRPSQIGDLIQAAFHNPPLVTRDQLSQLIRIGTDLEGLSSFARILGVSATSVCKWRMGAKHPMLPVYLRLARVFNVTLADLLTGRVSPGRVHSLDLAGVPHWRNLWARRRYAL